MQQSRITVKNANDNEEVINGLPIKILYLATTTDSSENILHLGFSPEPYFFIINDISFQLFFKKKRVADHYFWQWGLCKFKRIPELINIMANPIKVGIVSENFRKIIVGNLYQRILLQMLTPCFETFSIGYQVFFGRKPDISIKKELFDEFANVEGVPIAARMTTERMLMIGAKKMTTLLKEAGIPVSDA